MGALDGFWAEIDRQLEALRTAKTAEEVFKILGVSDMQDGKAKAFFAGGGGDGDVLSSLRDAGWTVVRYDAHYYWCAQAPGTTRTGNRREDPSLISYVEGDIYLGNGLLP